MFERKYKVWDKENKCWFIPIFDGTNGKIEEVLLCSRGYIMFRQFGNLDCTDKIQNRFEIVFYTGFKDKNDKEIYKGYILKRDTGYIFEVELTDWRLGNRVIEAYDVIEGEDEIIGNIYENPELLE